MMYYTQFTTPFCEIILAGDSNGLTHLHMNTGEGNRRFGILDTWTENPGFFSDTVAQIRDYLNGKRKQFDVRIHPRGTDFQKKVWKELTGIPYGALRTYKDIARAIGNEKAARAVGNANNRNPIPLIVPCHRVVGANGTLGGFAHGLSIKKRLIELECGTRLGMGT